MKRSVSSLRLFAAFLLALPLVSLAQTSAVPQSISYQGKVTDAAGVLVGNTTPVNRDVIFRIYDGPTSTTIIYAERQNVTIASGEFSVLIGVGAPVGTEPKPALDQAFLAADRYLGITVDDGNAGADAEISPRQQIATTPFAFRARIAESLATNAVSNSAMIANNAITGVNIAAGAITSAKIASGTIANDNLATNSVTSDKISNGGVATLDIADDAVTADKLANDIGVWSVNGTNVHRNSNVGIGNTSGAVDRLTISGGNVRLDSERYFAFSSSADNFDHKNKSMANYGVGSFVDSDLGANPALWLSGFDGIKFFTARAARMTITPGGQVGIGSITPDDQLNVYSANAEAAIRVQSAATADGPSDGIRIGTNGSNAFFHSYEPISMKFSTGAATPLQLEADGRVGVGGVNSDPNIGAIIKTIGKNYSFVIETAAGTPAFFFEKNGSAFKFNGGGWAASSDARLKTEVKNLSGSLDHLLQLRSVTFRFKDESRYGAGERTGFIAQEVEQVFPSWVTDGPDGFKAISVYGFESLAVQALRELRAEKDAQIAALTTRAESAEARLAALEKQVAALASKL